MVRASSGPLAGRSAELLPRPARRWRSARPARAGCRPGRRTRPARPGCRARPARPTDSQQSSPRVDPQVEPGLGVVDPQAGRLEARRAAPRAGRRSAPAARATCASSPSAATIAACTGAGTIMPGVLAHLEQLARPEPGHRRRTPPGSRPGWTAWTASGPRAGRRGCRRRPAGRSTDTCRSRPTPPAELGVALVARPPPRRARGPSRRPCAGARPAAPGRSGWPASSARPAGPAAGRARSARRPATGVGAGQPRPDLVRRVGDLGVDDDVAGAEAEQRRQPGDQLLGADRRQHRRRVDAGRAAAGRTRPTTASRSAGVPAVSG